MLQILEPSENLDHRMPAPRLIAIGDIHGHASALVTVLVAIAPQPHDTIVTLGDYVDCGPDSRGVIDQLIALGRHCRVISLLGNHEEMFLGGLGGGTSELETWLRVGGLSTLESYSNPRDTGDLPPAHLQFLEACLPYYETESYIFVHANYWPNRRMEEQSRGTLLWESLDPTWAAPHFSGKRVILGHSVQSSGAVLDLKFLLCIDTGCGYGGRLTAVELNSHQQWQSDERGQLLS